MLNRLKNPKWPLRGPKLANGVYPYVIGHSGQLLQIKFFYPSTPSMREVDNGGKQAGAELCQAQHSLGLLHLAWNFALPGAAYSASCV